MYQGNDEKTQKTETEMRKIRVRRAVHSRVFIDVLASASFAGMAIVILTVFYLWGILLPWWALMMINLPFATGRALQTASLTGLEVYHEVGNPAAWTPMRALVHFALSYLCWGIVCYVFTRFVFLAA
jgi:hypothetical protein